MFLFSFFRPPLSHGLFKRHYEVSELIINYNPASSIMIYLYYTPNGIISLLIFFTFYGSFVTCCHGLEGQSQTVLTRINGSGQ